jgi:chemotaxis protein MotA
MDIGVIVGLAIGVGSLVGGFLLEGGALGSLIQGPAMMIIFGGTIAATIVGMPLRRFMEGWRILAKVLTMQKVTPQQLIRELVAACEKARREGLLSLQKDVKEMKMPFTQKYLKMFITGNAPEMIAEMAEVELERMRERHAAGASVFTKMGGYSPTMGVIGTVMGLISTFSHAGGDPAKLVHSIAAAFIATFWGVAMANVFYLPIADKLKVNHQEELLLHAITLDGIACIQAGFTPKIVHQRLMAMLAARDQAVEDVGPSESDFAEVVEQ